MPGSSRWKAHTKSKLNLRRLKGITIVVTRHAVRRFRLRIGPKRSPTATVSRRVRAGIRRANRVAPLAGGAYLIRAPDFDAVVKDEGLRLVVTTVLDKGGGEECLTRRVVQGVYEPVARSACSASKGPCSGDDPVMTG